ncbi:FKBP-type peptidyl-prolyl cis-trans isomerase [Spirosoma soli]|uniref:Peptidyl-prolyl cis-trans isomerase n=1 Tax=Spirosoma soli TaxID=1770529 RepID=A0ABW5M5D6_9BACT
MRTFQLTIIGALFVGGLASCMQQVDSTNANYDQNDAQIQTYASAKQLGGQLTSTGLYYKITVANPTGRTPKVGEEVEFTYKSYNLQDVLVDSTKANLPVYYPFGLQSILAGLEEGLGLMHEGEKATLLIPSYLGYGDQAVNANLPAYSVVRFDVQLNRTRTETEQINDYIARNNLVITDSSATGLKFIKTQDNPAGRQPGLGQTLTIRYKGKMLRSASAFDSTGTSTVDVVLGQNRFIKGFEEGLSRLREGEKATVIFPSAIGYSTQGAVSANRYIVTPYAPLRFDLELVSAK